MNEWIEELSDLTAANEAVVMVTIAGIRGSAPREVGARMIVTAKECVGTIGGGQLEHQCTRIAVDMLGGPELTSVRTFPLGAAMGQCCGGVVDVLFEPMVDGLPEWLRDLRALYGQHENAAYVTHIGQSERAVVTAEQIYAADVRPVPPPIVDRAIALLEEKGDGERIDDWFVDAIVGTDFNIAVFGAGHVGTAVVSTLSQLDCNIRWIDSRRNIFRATKGNVRSIESPEPALEVAAMPPGSCYLVMTHSHALDFEICDRILHRRDAAYCGLIGSRSKRRRFEKRYLQQGMQAAVLDQLICPIGVDGISGKKPAEIAVAAAAEVLQSYERSKNIQSQSYPVNVHPMRP
jgi:xanthine dehydrogenase accessory factor